MIVSLAKFLSSVFKEKILVGDAARNSFARWVLANKAGEWKELNWREQYALIELYWQQVMSEYDREVNGIKGLSDDEKGD